MITIAILHHEKKREIVIKRVLPVVLAGRFIEGSDRVLRGWHAVARCRGVTRWNLIAGSHRATRVSSTTVVTCSGVSGVRVSGILGLNAGHPVSWVRTHRPVIWRKKNYANKVTVASANVFSQKDNDRFSLLRYRLMKNLPRLNVFLDRSERKYISPQNVPVVSNVQYSCVNKLMFDI